KPAQARLLVALWGVHTGRNEGTEGIPVSPPPGVTSVAADPSWSDAFLAAAGFHRCGKRIVRIDILERLGNLIRKQRFPERAKEPQVKEQPATIAVAEAPSDSGSSEPGSSGPEPVLGATDDNQQVEATAQAAREDVAKGDAASAPIPAAPKPRPGGFC